MADDLTSDGKWHLWLSSTSHSSVREILGDDNISGNELGKACIKVIETQIGLFDQQKRIDNAIIHQQSLQSQDEDEEQASKKNNESSFNPNLNSIASNLGKGDSAQDSQLLDQMKKLSVSDSSNWDRIPFTSKLLDGSKKSGFDLDEWIQRNEKYMRARLCIDERASLTSSEPASKRRSSARVSDATSSSSSDVADWKRFMVGLGKSGDLVFGSKANEQGIRVIQRPSQFTLNGLKLLDSNRKHQIKTCDLPRFKETFDRMTGNLLKGLNWNNVLVAGGLVLAALTSTTSKEEDEAKGSDVDVYLFGLKEEEAIKKLLHLESVFASNLPKGVTYAVLRNARTITFIPSKYPHRRLQVVLKMCKNPMEILLNFDLDPVGMGFDGEEVWMLPRTCRSLVTSYTSFTMQLIHGHYLQARKATQEERVFKYANRGYGIRFLPHFINPSVETVYEDQTDKMTWYVKKLTQSLEGETPELSHWYVDSRRYLSGENGHRSCLTSANLFFRHAQLWNLAKDGAVKLDESSRSFAECHYSEDPLSYDDGPELKWDQSFSLDALKTFSDKVNSQELGLLDGNLYTSWYEPSRDWRASFDKPKPKYEGEVLRRSICSNTLSEALNQDISLAIYLPDTFYEHAKTILPENSFRLAVDPKWEESRKRELDYRYHVWTKRGNLFQLMDRQVDEVSDILHAFRLGHSNINRSLGDREGSVRRFITRRLVNPTRGSEMQAFQNWVDVKLTGEPPAYRSVSLNGAFEVPPDQWKKRREMTRKEADWMSNEYYFGGYLYQEVEEQAEARRYGGGYGRSGGFGFFGGYGGLDDEDEDDEDEDEDEGMRSLADEPMMEWWKL